MPCSTESARRSISPGMAVYFVRSMSSAPLGTVTRRAFDDDAHAVLQPGPVPQVAESQHFRGRLRRDALNGEQRPRPSGYCEHLHDCHGHMIPGLTEVNGFPILIPLNLAGV